MEKIYKEYSKLIYNYLYSLSRDKTIAEDLTQDTFYKAIKNIKRFNNKSKISTWLCEIAKNTWIDYMRKEKKKEILSIDDERYIDNLINEESFENDIEERNEIIKLYKSIHKLDEKTKEVFYLRIKGELSFKEIGQILGKSEDWARIIFYRGKIKLIEEIKNENRM